MNNMETDIYKLLDKMDFSCQRCSKCCRIDPGAVFLTKTDLENISNHLSLSNEQFLKKYCRTIIKSNKIVISLLEKPNYDCIFWDKKGCIIYNVRPTQCKTYPFWPAIVESISSWNDESKRCKGINKKGNLTTEDKFNLYKMEKDAVLVELKNS